MKPKHRPAKQERAAWNVGSGSIGNHTMIAGAIIP
jgi:hypothetical protein